MTVNHDVAGSNPASGASGLFVKRLRHRPFTAGSGVRIPHRSPWAISSAGRASALQAECQQFDPVIAHHNEKFHVLRAVGFFIAFSLPPYLSFNLLHPRSRSFARRFAPSNDVRCGTSSILLSPTKRKHHVIRSVVLFSYLFPFSLRSCNLLHPRLTTFCASLRSFKMCSLRNQFDPVIAHHNEKFHVLRAVGFFVAISFFPHLSFPLPLKNLLHLTPQRGIIRKHMGH